MAGLYRDNRTFFGIEDETWTALALWAIISFGGISFNINRILNYFLEEPVVWDSAVIGIFSAVFILLGTVAALKKMERREFLLIIFIGMAWVVSYLLNEDARRMLSGSFFLPVLIYGFSGIICISHYKNWEKFLKTSYIFVIVGLLTFFIRSVTIINDENYMTDYMSFSYHNLVFVISAFWIAIHKKNIFMWIIALVATIVLMIVGSRGALMCVLVYILLEFLLSKKIHIAAKIAFFSIIALIFFNIETMMLEFDGFLKQYDYESRTIEKFFEGTLQDDSGRSNYFKCAWELIAEKPILGYGMAGSMTSLYEKIYGIPSVGMQGAYAHNLFLELLMHFGIFLGGFVSIWIIVHIIRAYVKSRNKNIYNILFVFFSLIFPKLMVTGTYLSDPEFFILLGLLLNLSYDKLEEIPEKTKI